MQPNPGPASGAVTTSSVDTPAAASVALDLLERAGADGPLVDEAERERLRRLTADHTPPPSWRGILAHRDDQPVGYAGMLLATRPTTDPADGPTADARSGPTGPMAGPMDRSAVGDLAVADDDRAATFRVLLNRLADLARHDGGTRLQVWVRQVTDDDLAVADQLGTHIDRELLVLARPLPTDAATPPLDPAVHIRPSRPVEDDLAIVDVLASAYAGTADGGWTLPRLRERMALDWFRPEDLLVAVDDTGRLLGLHWLKRRSPTVGEVYNLAVHPDAQGRALGPALLHAGLTHLTDVGCTEVVLWVDGANDRAVRVYLAYGFTPRSKDVAFGLDLTQDMLPSASSGPRD